jgi:hypothetical protein
MAALLTSFPVFGGYPGGVNGFTAKILSMNDLRHWGASPTLATVKLSRRWGTRFGGVGGDAPHDKRLLRAR